MDNRFQVIPRRYWRNRDGRRASLYGAVPYVNSADAEAFAERITARHA